MNWLAHVYLAEADPAARIGSLLPDLLPAAALTSLPAEFQRGIAQHRRIDAFTDRHAAVRRSVRRFESPLRRFGGILTDIFYDHFLARDWGTYSPEPLPEFTQRLYASFDRLRAFLPAAAARLDQLSAADWLGSYQDLTGIARALERMERRLRRPADLLASMPVLERQYSLFESDFRNFFPEVRVYAAELVAERG